MNDCIFCKIVAGEIPCAQVYSTDKVLAFLDIAPISKGHTLIIPRDHYENLWTVPEELGEEILLALKLVGKAIMSATGATGINVVMNNHRSAGQVVPHAHWHLIPRIEGDGLLKVVQGKYDSEEEMKSMAEAISRAI